MLGDVGGGDRFGGRAAEHVGAHEVPVAVEPDDDAAQVVEGDADRERELEGQRHLLVVEQLGADAGPPGLERDRGADLVEHAEQRRDAGLDGVLGEDALRERVQGADRGEVEPVERRLGALAHLVAGRVASGLLEAVAQPVAQLGRGPLGEGDRRDLLDRHAVLDDELLDPGDEHLGLARAGARVDEQRGCRVTADAVARRLVAQGLSAPHRGLLHRSRPGRPPGRHPRRGRRSRRARG